MVNYGAREKSETRNVMEIPEQHARRGRGGTGMTPRLMLHADVGDAAGSGRRQNYSCGSSFAFTRQNTRRQKTTLGTPPERRRTKQRQQQDDTLLRFSSTLESNPLFILTSVTNRTSGSHMYGPSVAPQTRDGRIRSSQRGRGEGKPCRFPRYFNCHATWAVRGIASPRKFQASFGF